MSALADVKKGGTAITRPLQKAAEGVFKCKEEAMSRELAKTYEPKGMEDRIYQKWMDKKYFHAEADRSRKPFTIVMPPPNVTGQLHM